jgi:hypothetical protein
MRSITIAAVAVAAMMWGGCGAPQRTVEGEDAPSAQHNAENEQVRRAAVPTGMRDIEVKELTASEAARRVMRMPPIGDPLVEREIKLYETLYHAAYTTNIGLITEHYLLDPPDDAPERWYPEGVDMAEDELLLRVLARLDRLNVPMRWMPADSPTALTEPVQFPGTNKLATRLGVRILDRIEEGPRGQPTVRARLTDATAHVGGARQNVTAVWDGAQWRLTRDRAFHVW